MTFDQFNKDEKTVDAVIMNFEVIGEASRHIPSDVKEAKPEIPWVEIMAMRNFIVHEYFGVSTKIIWDTVQKDLPDLVKHLKSIS